MTGSDFKTCARKPTLAVTYCGLLLISSACQAQSAPATAVASDEWSMERILRQDKEPLRGLVLRERKQEIEFIEIVRPQGKPMYLVVHHIPHGEVEEIDRLPQAKREELYDKIVPLLAVKSSGRIEQLRMEDVELEELVRDEQLWWVFENPWFRLESTAGEESTRRCAIRIVRAFAAFRHILPPRVTPQQKLRVVILGSMDEYRSRLEVSHPAFYERGTNTIYAASEMQRFARRLQQVRAQTRLRREQYEALDNNQALRLANHAEKLRANGHTEKEIQLELRAMTAAWRRTYDAALSRLNQTDRINENLFFDVSGEMFQRLKHEAFHAYFENYVFPHRDHDVPHWLNEGIAQLFEHAQLDSDRFRLDGCDPDQLERLKADLEAGRQLPLSELLRGNAKSFWASHDDSATSNRYYLHAWGLAHYLVFQHELFADSKLEDFVTRGSSNLVPEERLEALTGQPLQLFERRWHKYVMKLR